MSVDKTPGDVAVGQLQSLPFDNLIGSPLMAAVDAQSKAASAAVKFIQSVGFQEVNGKKEAINVIFTYMKGTEKVNLIVPLLTIVPIPYLRIDDMSIHFKAKINASSASKQTDTSGTVTKAGSSGSAGFWGAKVNFNASVSAKKDSTSVRDSKYSVEYTMDISVHAVQDDMPKGMASVLQILHESIDSSPAAGSFAILDGPSPASMETVGVARDATITFKVVDGVKEPVASVPVKITFIGQLNPKVNVKLGTAEFKAEAMELPTAISDASGQIKSTLTFTPINENFEATLYFQAVYEGGRENFSVSIKNTKKP